MAHPSHAKRACRACTLLCDDASRRSCELCGTDLPALDQVEELGSPSRVCVRACPSCTFLCENPEAKVCELCETALPPATKRPADQPSAKHAIFGKKLKMGGGPHQLESTLQTSPCSGKQVGTEPAPCLSQSSEKPSAAEPLSLTSEKPAVKEKSPHMSSLLVPGSSTKSGPSRSVALTIVQDGVAELSRPVSEYDPNRACWRQSGAPVPYRHLAAAFDALEATRSRLAKDTILTNTFRSMLHLQAEAVDLEAACYLLAPAKDAQTGGHRLRPDWVSDGRPLGIAHGSITAAVLEATGASRATYRQKYNELHEAGEVALALRESGGTQRLLVQPPPLTVRAVRTTLLGLADISGSGSERCKTNRLVGLMRAAKGTELKWLVRTFLPHMAVGISLEASVLPALGAAVVHVFAGHDQFPTSVEVKEGQEAMRTGFALCPDVGMLVGAVVAGGIDEVCTSCSLHVGVPMQPMLAKPSTSVEELVKRIVGAGPNDSPDGVVRVAAEHKYDGQRAQIHRTANGDIKLFSRKIDDMTYKYPDVVAALRRCATGSLPFVLDAEIVPIISRASGPTPSDVQESEVGNVKRGEIATFQSLATRKRKNVTTANAAETSVAVKVFLFDLLLLGNEVLLRKPFSERRAAMRGQFAEECDVLAFAEVVDIDIGPSEQQRAAPSEGSVAADCRVARDALEEALRSAVANSCEGLMVKRLDSVYEPSTKRSDSWLKLKKDYVDSMGDSLDLVPVGGWRGHGRKSRWISPFLVATYDPSDGTLGSVCRVMSGFSDKFYREATLRYLGKEIEVKSSAGVADADGDVDEGMCEEEEEDHLGEGVSSDSDEGKGRHPDHSDEEAVRSGCGKSLLRSGPAPGVVTGDKPSYWFEPTEVWEIRGADITVSPRHMSAQGLVDPVRGLSLRFPRFVRVRDDKRVADATTPEHFASMFRKQAQQQPEGEKRRRAE